MKKEFCVSVDITMSCNVYVDAESEEEAKAIALNYVTDDTGYYLRNGAMVNSEVVDVELES